MNKMTTYCPECFNTVKRMNMTRYNKCITTFVITTTKILNFAIKKLKKI